MAENITSAILQTSAAWAQAFRDYASTQRAMGNIELLIKGEKRIFGAVWSDFLKSRPAQVLIDNPPVPGTPWYVPEVAPIPVPETVPDTLPGPETTSAPEDIPPSVPEPHSIPEPVQSPKTPYTDTRAVSTSSNPLFELISQGLKDVGFVPEKAMSAEQVTSIAESTALSIVNTVIDRLEQEGKLGGKSSIVHYQIHQKPVKELQVRTPAFFSELLKLVLCGIPAFLVGPAGSGKTTAVEHLATVMDLPFTRVSLSAGVDEGILQGWLLPMELGGRFVYVPAPMVNAYEHGGIVLLDEIDSADANMLIILSAVLDESAWHIPLRSDKPALVKHDNVHFVAAANTWGHGADHKFVGANQLDERTLSRFRQGQISCDYDAELEAEIFDLSIVDFGHRLRQRCRGIAQFKRDVSTRDIALNNKKVCSIDKTTGKPVYTPEQAWFHHFSDWSEQEIGLVHAVRNTERKTVYLD